MGLVTVTLIRHAESEANADVKKENKIGGHNLQAKLTKKGEEQAEALGNYFRKKGVQFTEAYSSTAVRTQMTAELCFKQMGIQLPLTTDDQLSEQSAGGWEGQSRDIYNRKDVRLALDTDNWSYIPGDDKPGESQKMVSERIKRWVDNKMARCQAEDKDKNHHIVVFTHGGAIKFLLAELLDLHRPTAYTEAANPTANTSITQLCYKNGQLQLPLAMRNNTEHLN